LVARRTVFTASTSRHAVVIVAVLAIKVVRGIFSVAFPVFAILVFCALGIDALVVRADFASLAVVICVAAAKVRLTLCPTDWPVLWTPLVIRAAWFAL